MKLLKGKLFLSKINESKILTDSDNRQYIDVVVCINDYVEENNKAGVIQQNTAIGEKRIYLANLYLLDVNRRKDDGQE